MNPQRGAVFLRQFNKMKVTVKLYGGYEDAERKMLGFAAPEPEGGLLRRTSSRPNEQDDFYPIPDGEALPEGAFPITPVTITYNTRFSKELTHRDFLGSVLGLGLDRGKIGDIRLVADGAVMYAAREVASFIAENLVEVGRATVTAAPNTNITDIKTPGIQKRITAASLRLDTIISEALHLSRSKVAALIEREKVFVNWVLAKKTLQLGEGDIVTVRQVGRLKIDEIIGATKKDRVALLITVF